MTDVCDVCGDPQHREHGCGICGEESCQAMGGNGALCADCIDDEDAQRWAAMMEGE